jgi:hypothetical protein
MEFDVLHPQHDEHGVWRFDPAEVDQVAARHTRAPARVAPRLNEETRAIATRGRVAARVFKMFARHMALPQIVVLTKQPPEVVRALYDEWMKSLDEGHWERLAR